MSARIITPGHIKVLQELAKCDYIIIGLLTAKALKGYKKEIVPYKDRKFILDFIAKAIGGMRVVPQTSLDPSENINRYGCNAIASGDGWEKSELACIKKNCLATVRVVIPGEKAKRYSSSSIIKNMV